MQTQEYLLKETGYFWWHVSSQECVIPKDAVVGELTIYHTGVAVLVLHGKMAGQSDTDLLKSLFSPKESLPEYKAIIGVLTGGKQTVLLWRLIDNGANITLVPTGFSSHSFLASHCIVGGDNIFNVDVEADFSAICINLNDFEGWWAKATTHKHDENGNTVISYKRPEKLRYDISGGALEVSFYLDAKEYNKYLKIEMQERAKVCFYFKPSINIESFIKKYIEFQSLITLITNSTKALQYPTILLPNKRPLGTLYFKKSNQHENSLKRHEYWTNFSDISGNLGAIIDSWADLNKKHQTAIDIFMSVKRLRSLPIENIFQNIVFSIESLHRSEFTGQKNTALTEKVNRITTFIDSLDCKGADLNGGDKRWLKSKLKYADEPSLAERIVDILSGAPFELEGDQLKEFAKKVAGRRNDLAHFGGPRQGESYDIFYNDLDVFISALELTYQFVLLHRIGVSKEKLLRWYHQGPESFKFKETFFNAGLINDNPRTPRANLKNKNPDPNADN